MVKGAKVVKGNERVPETSVAMDVVEDMTVKEPMEIPSEIGKLNSLIDKTLTELHSNVEIENNMEILQRIRSAITEGTLEDSEKEQLLGTMTAELNLQNLDNRELFLAELEKAENPENDALEAVRLRMLETKLVRAKNTTGAAEITQRYLTKITDLEIRVKVAALRRYVAEGVGEIKLKSWLDLVKVEAEVMKELEARSRHVQLTRILSLIQTTAMAKGEKADWKKKIKIKIQKAYEQWSEEWETGLENLEQSTLPEEQLRDQFQQRRKELREDVLLTKFDKDTMLAQLDQLILNRNMGDLLQTQGKETSSQANEPALNNQVEVEGNIASDQMEAEGAEKRKLDDVIKEARQKKGKQDQGVFRGNTVREECTAPTIADQRNNVDNISISAHQRTSNAIIIIDITEKWTGMDELIPFLERLTREQGVEIRQEVGTTGWKQTVQESDWKIWRNQSTTCIILPLTKHYDVNTSIMRGGKSILRTEVFSVIKVLKSGTQVPVMCCYLPSGHDYSTLADAVATTTYRGGANEWETICGMVQCIRTDGYKNMGSQMLVIPRVINRSIPGNEGGRRKWNREVIFEVYEDCYTELKQKATVTTVGPYRFMIGDGEAICKNFEPATMLIEPYLCTMLEGIKLGTTLKELMEQIQRDNEGFDYSTELSGVLDGYDKSKGARRIFLIWHRQLRVLTVKGAVRASGLGNSGSRQDCHIRFEVMKDLPGFLEIISNWKAARGNMNAGQDDRDDEVVVVSRTTREMKSAPTPGGWEVTPKRHTLKTPDSQLGCLSVYEQLFKNEAEANRETRDTIEKHLPAIGTAHNILVDRHEALQQRVERSEAYIMQMLKMQGKDPGDFLAFSETVYEKQLLRPEAVNETLLQANEKVDVDDIMAMLEKGKKRMKEIDAGKADNDADY